MLDVLGSVPDYQVEFVNIFPPPVPSFLPAPVPQAQVNFEMEG